MNIADSQLQPYMSAPSTNTAFLSHPATVAQQSSALAPSASQTSEKLDNPLWKSQYEKWKQNSFGRSDSWKDTHIPKHLQIFREHDKSIQDDLNIKNYALTKHVSVPEMRETTKNQIKAYYKEKYGMDIDPDNTFLITFAYNTQGHSQPYPGVIVSKISLTEAAIKNRIYPALHEKLPKGSYNRHTDNPPAIEVVENLTIGYHRSSGRHAYQNDPKTLQTQQYEGIYFEPPGEEIYEASHQAPISAKSFRDYVEDTNFSNPHKAELKKFWSENKETYTALSKASFTSAAHLQYKEESLTKQGRDLALRAANISPDKTLESLTGKAFQQAYVQDPDLEVKHLSFRGHESSNIIYVTDKNTQKTVLYIPGNSSPLHEFDNPEAMRKWLTEQMTDPKKREQLGAHFRLRDRADSVWEAGLDTQLENMEMYVDGHVRWLEGRPFGGTPIEGDPFKSIQERVEKFTYNDASYTYVTNDDVKRKKNLEDMKAVSRKLIVLAPVALVAPPLAVIGTLTLAFDLGVAGAEIAMGVDDAIKGKPGATDCIVFGALNAGKTLGSKFLSKTVGGALVPD